MVWLCFRVQKVGYAGRELVVSNYLRTERIPFDSIEAVEPVWWNYRRMVRIRLRTQTSFGQTVYYIPKWAAFKCMWVAPEKELRELRELSGRIGLLAERLLSGLFGAAQGQEVFALRVVCRHRPGTDVIYPATQFKIALG